MMYSYGSLLVSVVRSPYQPYVPNRFNGPKTGYRRERANGFFFLRGV